MRGKDRRYEDSIAGSRITPAYAGKSHRQSGRHDHDRDHPRLCGEKSFSGDKTIIPHRITPAYAGKRAIRMRDDITA